MLPLLMISCWPRIKDVTLTYRCRNTNVSGTRVIKYFGMMESILMIWEITSCTEAVGGGGGGQTPLFELLVHLLGHLEVRLSKQCIACRAYSCFIKQYSFRILSMFATHCILPYTSTSACVPCSVLVYMLASLCAVQRSAILQQLCTPPCGTRQWNHVSRS